jgi:CBS domain-containing protein
MQVVELMRSPVHTCSRRDNLARAAQLMWDNDCGALAVLDEHGTAVAMITDRDICMAAYTQGRALADIPVPTAASKHLFYVRPTDAVDYALSEMALHRVRRMPVLDVGGNLIGILTLGDLLRAACEGAHATRMPATPDLVRKLADLHRPHWGARSSHPPASAR